MTAVAYKVRVEMTGAMFNHRLFVGGVEISSKKSSSSNRSPLGLSHVLYYTITHQREVLKTFPYLPRGRAARLTNGESKTYVSLRVSAAGSEANQLVLAVR